MRRRWHWLNCFQCPPCPGSLQCLPHSPARRRSVFIAFIYHPPAPARQITTVIYKIKGNWSVFTPLMKSPSCFTQAHLGGIQWVSRYPILHYTITGYTEKEEEGVYRQEHAKYCCQIFFIPILIFFLRPSVLECRCWIGLVCWRW